MIYFSIRGALGTILSFAWTLGIVIGYMLSSWMNYVHVPYVSVALGGIFLLTFVWLPESPDYLIYKSNYKAAERSFAFYGKDYDKETLNHSLVVEQDKQITWKDFKKPEVRRGITIAWVLIFFADTCGIFTITNYMTELLHWANIEIDIYLATVILGLIQIVGCVVSALCMDRFGRRVLFITSSVLSAVSMYVFGFYYFLLSQPRMVDVVKQLQWLPIVSLATAILAASLAIAAAPFFLIAELLPTKLRGRVTTIALGVSWLVAFSVVHSFHFLVEALGVHGTYWLYASVCVVELVFVYFFLPETKNLTIEQIQEVLRKKVFVN